jgi:hypothetical protein
MQGIWPYIEVTLADVNDTYAGPVLAEVHPVKGKKRAITNKGRVR